MIELMKSPTILPKVTGAILWINPPTKIVSGWGIIKANDNKVILAILCSKPMVINANRHQKIIINFAILDWNLKEHHTARQTNILHKIPRINN